MTNRHPFLVIQIHPGMTIFPLGCQCVTRWVYFRHPRGASIFHGRCIFIPPGVFRSPPLNGSLGRWVLSYTQCLITTERCTPRHIVMPSLDERVYQVGVYVSYTDCPFPETHFGIHLMNVVSGKIASTYELET